MNVISAVPLLVPTPAGDRLVPLVLRYDVITGAHVVAAYVPVDVDDFLVIQLEVEG